MGLETHATDGFFALGVVSAACDFPLVPTPPDITVEVLIYGVLVLGLFAVLWIFYDRRDRALYDAQRRKVTFHCIRCDHLYTELVGTETADCPKCGHHNVRLKF